MKKTIIIFMCLMMCFLSVACKSKNTDNGGNMNSKSLVLYFSATGTTEKVAKKIANVSKSDVIRIVPKEEYSSSDLDYNVANSRANREQNDENARPEMSNQIFIDKYETIYLGFPIWWGTVPKIILTLIDQVDFKNKKIFLFCTSGSSGIEQSVRDLSNYDSHLNIIDGKRFDIDDEEIEKWIKSTEEQSHLYIKINDRVMNVSLEDNISVKALIEKLKEGDIKIEMSDYGNFEKVGELGFTLPTDDKDISVDAGDIILYQGSSITIYYDKNRWNFTKLGKIENISKEELREFLGDESIVATFTLNA